MGYPGAPMVQQQQVRPGPPPNQGFYQGAGPQMGPGGPYPPQMMGPGMGAPTHHPGMGPSPGMMPQHPQQYAPRMANQPAMMTNVGLNNMGMGQMMPMAMGHPRQMSMVQRPMHHPMTGMVATGPQPGMGVEQPVTALPNPSYQFGRPEVPMMSRPPAAASPFGAGYQGSPAAAATAATLPASHSPAPPSVPQAPSPAPPKMVSLCLSSSSSMPSFVFHLLVLYIISLLPCLLPFPSPPL